jgi:hypothetical protein
MPMKILLQVDIATGRLLVECFSKVNSDMFRQPSTMTFMMMSLL